MNGVAKNISADATGPIKVAIQVEEIPQEKGRKCISDDINCDHSTPSNVQLDTKFDDTRVNKEKKNPPEVLNNNVSKCESTKPDVNDQSKIITENTAQELETQSEINEVEGNPSAINRAIEKELAGDNRLNKMAEQNELRGVVKRVPLRQPNTASMAFGMKKRPVPSSKIEVRHLCSF